MGSIPGQGTKILYATWPKKKYTHTHTHIYICIYINPVENCTMVLLVSNMVYFLYKTNACFKITSKQIGFLQKIMDVSLNVMPWASNKKLLQQLNHNLRWCSIAKTEQQPWESLTVLSLVQRDCVVSKAVTELQLNDFKHDLSSSLRWRRSSNLIYVV